MEKIYTADKNFTLPPSDGIDKFHLWVSISQEFLNIQEKQ